MMFLILIPLLLASYSSANPDCAKPLITGTRCDTTDSSVRFYFDTELQRCLAFNYTGCGGNQNNFPSWKKCHQNCIPADRLMCPGNTKPLKNVQGISTQCGTVAAEGECPSPDAFCQKGHEDVGICCSDDARKKGEEDHSPKCSNNAAKFQVTVPGGNRKFTRLGKNCDTNFCPNGYKCTQGHFYSFCCKK